jgi:glycosyltransferase involved in cell wall biosynthesis
LLKNTWIKLIERRSIAQASGIHVTSEIEQNGIEEFGMKTPPFYCVPNGIEKMDMDSLERAQSKVLPNFPYVLFLSRINWKKGLDRVIRAWRDVPDMTLVIAGNDEEGYQAEIEQLARAVDVDDRIRFIGPVHGAHKWLLFKNAELFILPSRSENFGIVVLEAMAMSCPVIVTPEMGIASTVAEANCGRVVAGEPRLLASAVNDLLGDEEKRKSMGESGKAMAENRFQWDRIAGQMEQVYGQLTGAFGIRESR